ncbi:pantetheine-phosphate adenylyltransferase [Liquorilactobacillus vini]|uniref:Phosphopantetheine adenylyltransferase n=1 Tax=Liquorilactobacillus vini DSM 20605 TaxID=1133569 RepID=A0A0R2CMV6_9LACO|nr:pantetheine-phosphate adenylyltransferase [Liquorilactobacillus vini]KRM89171.1 phosphopantetheine adenylyltransferase [Liquorilactobacillus vini DSM 20605]
MKAVFPGSFDPVTNGHLDIIQRASKIFDQVIVLVMTNTSKQGLFSVAERQALLQETLTAYQNVTVKTAADHLTVQAVNQLQARIIIRGVRNVKDFDFEKDMAILNRKLDNKIETLFLPSSPEFSMISSSYIKEIAYFGGSLRKLVPASVEVALKKRLKINE